MQPSIKTCLPRVNLRQITLQRGYIHPSEQPLVFIQLHINDFTFIAHVQKLQSKRL